MQRGELLLSVGTGRCGLAGVLYILALSAAKVEDREAFQVAERFQRGGTGFLVGTRDVVDVGLKFRVCNSDAVGECRQRLAKQGAGLGGGGLCSGV